MTAFTYKPHGYQERAIQFLLEQPSGALFLDPGMGKTSVTLTALSKLLDRFEIGKILVVAPLRVVQSVWEQEASKWAHLTYLKFSTVLGSAKQRIAALSQRADIYLINYENLPWLIENVAFAFDAVIFDEASKMKSHKAKRFKLFKRIRHLIDRVWLLTGTPASNGLLDVWSQIFLLDRGERLGKTFTGFRDRYFISDYHGYNWTLRKNADQKIYDRLADVCLTLTAEDYLELPRRIDTVIDIDLPAKARDQYIQLERNFLAELGDETVEVLHAAALTNKLLQFANGAIYTDEEKNWTEVHDAKLTALAELVDEAAGQPLLIAYTYQTDAKRIREQFPQAEIIGKDTDTIERWNRGEIPMLLAHPASAGHGLNLQHGGNTIIWFGLNWSLELYQQFNARLHRQGQQKPVIIHHLAVRDTVDQTVLSALRRKDMTQKALLNALKEDIERRV